MLRLESELPLQDSLDSIQALLEGFHSRSVGESDEVMAWTVKEIPSLGRIQIKKDARHDLKNKELESVDVFPYASSKFQSYQ